MSEWHTNNRILLLDYMRVVTAFLVIFGHLYDPTPDNYVRMFIYQFHMPLFFVVSGMLHRAKPVGYLAKRLLWPVVIFVWFYYLLCYPLYHCGIWQGATQTQQLPFLPFIGATCKDLMLYFIDCKGWGPSWFIIALFYVKLMTIGADALTADCKQRIPSQKRSINRLWRGCQVFMMLIPVGIGFFIVYQYGRWQGYPTWRNVGYLANALMAWPYYQIGRLFAPCLGQYVVRWKAKSKNLVVALLCCAVVCLLVALNGGTSMFAILFGHLARPWNFVCCYLSGVAGTWMLLHSCLLFPQQLGARGTRFVRLAATSLMGVVGFQYFFCEVVRHTIGLEQPYWLSFLLSLLIYAICVCLWQFCRYLHLAE